MHRILFTIGHYPIYSYGVMVALGVLFGSLAARGECRRMKIDADLAMEGMVLAVVLGILLARVAYVVQNVGWFSAHPVELLDFRAGGMSIHGGYIGLILATFITAWRGRIRAGDLFDCFAPGLILGMVFGRMGCFLNGCCYGRVSDVPWAIRMPDDHGMWLPRHPTQLYEMAGALVLFFFLTWWLRRHRVASGEVFWGFLATYSVLRFTVEFFRDGTLLPGGLSLAQYVSIGVMAVSVVAIAVLRFRAAPRAVLAESPSTPA